MTTTTTRPASAGVTISTAKAADLSRCLFDLAAGSNNMAVCVESLFLYASKSAAGAERLAEALERLDIGIEALRNAATAVIDEIRAPAMVAHRRELEAKRRRT